MTSSIYKLQVVANTPNIDADNDILEDDIVITKDHVSPGGGGTLRIMFAMSFAVSPAIVSIFNNTSLKGTLNADNSSDINDDGYYRFDIDIEEDDLINIQASQQVTGINFIRAHLVQVGA